jgi:hypothetical protein
MAIENGAALKSSTYARYLELVVREFGPPSAPQLVRR